MVGILGNKQNLSYISGQIVNVECKYSHKHIIIRGYWKSFYLSVRSVYYDYVYHELINNDIRASLDHATK